MFSRTLLLSNALGDLRRCLQRTFQDQSPTAVFSWELGERAVSEIGGRLLEDFTLTHLPLAIEQELASRYERVTVSVPSGGRTVEDIRVSVQQANEQVVMLIDIKGHNEQRRGSRPNLASLRKCVELYSAPQRSHEEVVIFFCRYLPFRRRVTGGWEVTLRVQPESFSEVGVFPLRFLSRANLDPANIGSGGQLLLARENTIALDTRSREDFVLLLHEYQARLRGTAAAGGRQAVDAGLAKLA